MTFRASLTALVLATAALTTRAADDENPYKNTKVGDYVTYTVTTKFGAFNVDAVVTQTVTAKTDKEATVTVAGSFDFGGMKKDIPTQEQKIDLTKPYDPAKAANLPGGAEVKTEKLKEGKEKIKVNGKEYDASWTTYKVKAKAMGQEIEGEMKTWTAKDVPGGIVKSVMNAEVANQKMEVTMELKETGNKK